MNKIKPAGYGLRSKRMQILRVARLDEVVGRLSNGCYTLPANENRVKYDLRALNKYAQQHKIEPADLTEQELVRFVIKPKMTSN